MEQRTQIGYLVGDGLKENFRVRLVLLRDNYPTLMSILAGCRSENVLPQFPTVFRHKVGGKPAFWP
ncbi:MAG: hypothetical protein HZB19_19050 [Chloroflexi bacterium]|nr:hypothetical protein [Chloroflexota bacterium]